MTYTRRAMAVKVAKVRSKSKVPTSDTGHCLREVRECLAVGADAPTAIQAWARATRKHMASDKRGNALTGTALSDFLKSIPRGVPVFWAGGSTDAGHVALATGYGSNCYSTDIIRAGYFDKVRITQIHESWGLTLLGWTEDLNGVRVFP